MLLVHAARLGTQRVLGWPSRLGGGTPTGVPILPHSTTIPTPVPWARRPRSQPQGSARRQGQFFPPQGCHRGPSLCDHPAQYQQSRDPSHPGTPLGLAVGAVPVATPWPSGTCRSLPRAGGGGQVEAARRRQAIQREGQGAGGAQGQASPDSKLAPQPVTGMCTQACMMLQTLPCTHACTGLPHILSTLCHQFLCTHACMHARTQILCLEHF